MTDPQSNNYKWFVLAILTVVYAFNFIDRQILVILQEPIKAELGLSDTQLGLLTGFSFAVVYVTAGIPIAWLADRSNRRNIVAVSLGIWSVMTALSGMVQNYTQLLLARLGVGLGEAGGRRPRIRCSATTSLRSSAAPHSPSTPRASISASFLVTLRAVGSRTPTVGVMHFLSSASPA